MQRSSVFVSSCSAADLDQDVFSRLHAESYASHLIADPKTYGDLSPCGRTTDDEDDANLRRINDSSLEEQDVPLPQPGDMHMKFKKSSLPKRAKLSKNQSIRSHFRWKSKGDLCDKILKLESEVNDLKEEIRFSITI